MSASKNKAIIDTAFCALARAAESHQESSSLLDRAVKAAEDGERRHRRMGRGLGTYALSVKTAARYFVVKWYTNPHWVAGALDACSIREDVLYSSALRECLDALHPNRSIVDAKALLNIDYAKDIAK